MELKKEIVEKYEGGMRVRDLTVAYHIPRTTISTIVKNKDIIKSANIVKGVKSISKQRSETLDHVEKLLLLWITEKQCAGDSVSEAIICNYYYSIFNQDENNDGKTNEDGNVTPTSAEASANLENVKTFL
ncbi:putative CENPB DNA-binding domain-containing protein 1 [Centruroides vittatus]|uniref:putative CENPB DNA-binding domain-containing protein 1 n=1 Tax=Centruroides vittatus TaxID=120091 RepID=UPI00350E8E32